MSHNGHQEDVLKLSAAERKAKREQLRAKREGKAQQAPSAAPSATYVVEGIHDDKTSSPRSSQGRMRSDSNGDTGSVKSSEDMRHHDAGNPLDKSINTLDTASERITTRSMNSRRSGASARSSANDPKRMERDERRRQMVKMAQDLLNQKVETVNQAEFVPTVTTRPQEKLDFAPLTVHRPNSHLSTSSLVASAPTRGPSELNPSPAAYGSTADTDGKGALYTPCNDESRNVVPPMLAEATEQTPLVINSSHSDCAGVEPVLLREVRRVNSDDDDDDDEGKPLHCCWGCCSCSCCGKDPNCCCYKPCSSCCRKSKAPCTIQ